ncbi:MAG: bifunctional diaminohydroxyphosphoribosylaminopyrimidine deaminase/5-amino-6-(5-phosphoribosylamino)uracil reductase RibD [Bdellovibrionales bacterium]|nr:bifunctional diaminohydroxyphosphoribosylaminopyrimidine deaminase/5-amino-6-(5-phosphoribosylamino)uracil reductase RibD [Bdellovibrionales bacterium]
MKNWKLRDGFALGGRLDRTLSDRIQPLFPAPNAPNSNDPQQQVGDDLYWMEQALLTAMEGVGWTCPNPSVGAVIMDPKTGKEISRGFTQAFRCEHAERMAVLNAKNKPMDGATLYVTLEPCSHTGNQPPCADLVIKQGIKRVVIGSSDNDPRVNGGGIKKLQDAGIEVVTGIFEDECQAWHFPFLRSREPLHKIVWIAKWAQTLDGDMADAKGDSKWITGPKSRAYTHWLRQKYDVIVIGAETFLKDHPRLTVRDCAQPHRRNPMRVIVDPKNKLATHNLDPEIRVIKSWGKDLVKEVESIQLEPPLQSVMVEGGPALLNALILEDVFDAVHQFVAPKTFSPIAGANSSRYRVNWLPSTNWYCAAHQKIDADDLHEWVKCF